MKIILERHRYAPELNKAYVGPTKAKFAAPGCQSIADVRKMHFAALKYKGRYVTLKAENAGKSSYNRTRHGFCNDLRSLSGALKVFRAYHNLPGCVHTITTKLIG